MKKILFFATALAGLFLAGSCQRENLEPAGNTVTYTVQLADAVGTKAPLGDDITAVNQLVYEVWRTQGEEITAFNAEKDNLLYHRTAKVDKGVATIELEFVNDQNFTVLFWAHTAGNNVYNVEHLTNVTIESPDVANNPDAQAFVGRDFVRDCVSDKGGKVTLTRPVAQLNIGTTYASLDAFNPGNEADVTITGSSVKVTGLATSYNIATLSAGAASTVAYEYNYNYNGVSCPLPTEPLNVNGTDYKYVAMNYVGFPANGGSNVTVTYVINTSEGNIDNEDAPIENVPVKANYRTNIIGNLITSKTDYIVTLDNTWGGAEVVELWDGETLKAPKTNAAGEYVIECASELAWLAAAVNGTLPPTTRAEGSPAPNNFEGKTIILSENIHLNNKEWTPIGKESARFHGTFDGKGHTIYGLSILKYHGQRQHALFGSVAINPTIKNLIIDGANVIMPKGHDDDFYASALISSFYGTLKVQNVTVQNSNFAGNNKIGGLLAHDAECTSMIIDNCHVLNCDIRSTHITDGGNVGGLLGYFQGQSNNEHKITNSSVKESTIIAINSKNSGHRSNGQFVGCLSGKDNQILVIEDCVIEGNDFSQTINGTDPVTYVSPYGVFVGGNRNDDGKGTVIVDGVEMVAPGLTKVEGTYLVTSSNTLQTALERVAEGETIKLEADLTITEPAHGQNALNFNRAVNCTIDLNGKTLSADTGNSVLRFNLTGSGATSDVTLTLKNGKVVAGENTWCAVMSAGIEGAKAILDLQGVTVENSKPGDLGVKAWENGVVKAKNVTVNSTNCAGGFYAAGGEVILDECTVNQSGLYTEPYLSMALAVSSNGKMTVNSGTYKSEPTSAEQGNNQGTSHGSWVAGIMNSGGTMIINGGTFTNGNFGDDALATAARGLLLADTGANLQINGGTFNAVKAIVDVTNNLGDASRNPSVTLAGGNFSADPRVSGLYASELISVAEGYAVKEEDGKYKVIEYTPAAKVGNTEYGSIDEAIANWTNNSTLTLLSDVTLSDVVTLKSTEHHILDLGTYTMTAAEGKNAFVIQACGTGDAERNAITIKADTTTPGGINAGKKCIIYYKYADGGISGKDRPIIKIEGGVFNGSTSAWGTAGINFVGGSEARMAATLNITGGTFNCTINGSGKSKLLISGGVFNYSVGSQGDSTALRLIWGGKFKTLGFMTADDNNTKFWFGTAMAKSDVGVYIDKDNYLVVGGDPITAENVNASWENKEYTTWSNAKPLGGNVNLLKYSSAATYGLYYEK